MHVQERVMQETKVARMADMPRDHDGAVAALAKAVGVKQFGVNHIVLRPGVFTAKRHWHEQEDEFVLVLDGEATLIDENGTRILVAGDIVGSQAARPMRTTSPTDRARTPRYLSLARARLARTRALSR